VQAPDRGLPAPDLVLYLDIPLGVAEQRGGYGQERYEKREMQQQVRDCRAAGCGAAAVA
jgi:dTMP kinase